MRTGCQLGWILASKIHQNLLLDGSWAVLWPSWAVLGRLGALLRRLEEASKNDAKKACTKSRQKMRLQTSSAIFWGVSPRPRVGGPRPGHGEGFRSGALNYHLPTKKNTQQRQRRKTKDERWRTPTHAVAQSAVADI